jgi:hypothetical protein
LEGAASPPNKGNGQHTEDPFTVFSQAKSAWRRINSNSTFGHIKGRAAGYQPKWCKLVEQHGGEVVVQAVKLFAEDVKKGSPLRFPVAVFLKDPSEWIEGALAELKPADPTSDPELDMRRLDRNRDR